MKLAFRSLVLAFLGLTSQTAVFAVDPPPPVITNLVISGSQRALRFDPYPAAQAYTIFSGTNLALPLTANTNFFQAPYVIGYSTNFTTNGPITVTNFAYEWRVTNVTASSGYYRVGVTPMDTNLALSATLLNRLAYGPTPDELERVGTNAQGYINEQVAMEGIPETLDNYIVDTVNSIPNDPTTNWNYISVTGKLSGLTFYLYMSQPGDMYIDDIQLRPIWYSNYISTNIVSGTNVYITNQYSLYDTNLLINSDFEAALASPWVSSGGAVSSAIDPEGAHTGTGGLHLIDSAPGSTSANNLKQTIASPLTNNHPVILSYWYRMSPTSSRFKAQVNGSGLISSAAGLPPTPGWIYATATGPATNVSQIYIYLSGAGDAYLDDVKLVAGSTPEAGPNLVANGGFESSLGGSWTMTTDFAGTSLSPSVAHSGNSSLHVVATAGGGGSGDSVYQVVSPALTIGQIYTVSYWYLPARPGVNLTVRLSGSYLSSTPDTSTPGLNRRLNTTTAGLSDYRAWFTRHAVFSQRQLFEVLSQFWENHFVTQQSKSRDYLGGFGYDGTTTDWLATNWEFREMTKWRNAMLNPDCAFYDLLKISAESPAMVVYLDTVNSKGNANNVANENYARELLELFTYGVDNGYDQTDITVGSRNWTGWSVDLVDPADADSPFATASTTYYANTNSTSKANTLGVWALNYKSGNHGTNRAPIFAGKTVPARFGAPWAGRNYQLNVPNNRTGNAGMQDGYDMLTHIANQPFTEEFISIKLCRLFVHDDFPNPTTDPTQSGYAFYDYTDPNHSAEAELVRQCMLTWENSNPKGQIRAVLNTIFNSDLFRSQTGAGQKVKTPLEFVASSIRALRSVNADGSATSTTDGYAFASPLSRMGQMNLFDRDAPDGYPEAAARWISAGTLVERIRFLQAFCIAPSGSTRSDAGNNTSDPVALLKKKLPSASWTNPGAVADYFLAILYPGEGKGNLGLYRAAAINFLNTSDDGLSSSDFSGLNATNYDTRVRAMVAMLMTSQRFHEQ